MFRPQLWIFMLALLGLAGALFYPYRVTVNVEGVALPEREVVIEANETARLLSIKQSEGDVVKGDLIASMDNPELQHELHQLKLRKKRLEWTLGQSSFVGELLASESQLRAQLLEATEQISAVEQRLDSLKIRSPVDGYFVPTDHLPDDMSWVSVGTELGTIYSHNRVVMGYVNASQRHQIDLKNRVYWESNVSQMTQRLESLSIASQATDIVDLPMLLTAAGGSVSARRTPEGWIPDEALYKFKTPHLLDSSNQYSHERGTLEIPARVHSNWMLFSTAVARQVQQDFGLNFGLLTQ